jgi:hypothetical protein
MEGTDKTKARLVGIYRYRQPTRKTVSPRISSEVIVERMILLYYENDVLNLGWPRRIDGSEDDWQAEANR